MKSSSVLCSPLKRNALYDLLLSRESALTKPFFCRQNLKRLAGPNSDELLRDHREFSRDGTVSRA